MDVVNAVYVAQGSSVLTGIGEQMRNTFGSSDMPSMAASLLHVVEKLIGAAFILVGN